MSDTFSGGKRSMQPQFSGGAPRAADPGMGAGPRPYAAGATAAYRAQDNPLAREAAAPPGAYPTPGSQPMPMGMPGQSGQQTSAPAGNPMLQMQVAQSFAQRLVDMLYQRNQQRRSG